MVDHFAYLRHRLVLEQSVGRLLVQSQPQNPLGTRAAQDIDDGPYPEPLAGPFDTA